MPNENIKKNFLIEPLLSRDRAHLGQFIIRRFRSVWLHPWIPSSSKPLYWQQASAVFSSITTSIPARYAAARTVFPASPRHSSRRSSSEQEWSIQCEQLGFKSVLYQPVQSRSNNNYVKSTFESISRFLQQTSSSYPKFRKTHAHSQTRSRQSDFFPASAAKLGTNVS